MYYNSIKPIDKEYSNTLKRTLKGLFDKNIRSKNKLMKYLTDDTIGEALKKAGAVKKVSVHPKSLRKSTGNHMMWIPIDRIDNVEKAAEVLERLLKDDQVQELGMSFKYNKESLVPTNIIYIIVDQIGNKHKQTLSIW